MVGHRPWAQSLDFEGLPFRCRKCFSIGHLASDCSLPRHISACTWWKDAIADHLTIYAFDSDSVDSSQEDETPSWDDVVPLTAAEVAVNVVVSVPVASIHVAHVLQLRSTPTESTFDVPLQQQLVLQHHSTVASDCNLTGSSLDLSFDGSNDNIAWTVVYRRWKGKSPPFPQTPPCQASGSSPLP